MRAHTLWNTRGPCRISYQGRKGQRDGPSAVRLLGGVFGSRSVCSTISEAHANRPRALKSGVYKSVRRVYASGLCSQLDVFSSSESYKHHSVRSACGVCLLIYKEKYKQQVTFTKESLIIGHN